MQRPSRLCPQRSFLSWKLCAGLLIVAAVGFCPGPKGQARTGPTPRALPLQLTAGQVPGPAADFLDGGTAWLNTATPLTAQDLRGRVVLLDFWTLC